MVSKEFFEFISAHCGNVVAWLLTLWPFIHELYNYSKEISHTRIEQELECRNAKRNYNKILKELYLLTLKAYKNPSEQIKQLHDELNKL